ncbi:MAG: HAMP domain-containing histidine kinase [Anaerolineae bacterium]|nr:HAMP domain-containing histidine kinase [Anaerolineae bacterium]
MKLLRWLPTLLPILIGSVVGLILTYSPKLPNPIIYLRTDTATAIFIFSLGISALAISSLAIWDWIEATRLNAILHAREDRRQFLLRLDHELKNPLTAILAGLANLSAEKGEMDTLDSVNAQVHRIRTLVANLRKLSDLEMRPSEHYAVNLATLLNDLKHLFHDSAEKEDRKLVLSLPHAPWPLPTILGDTDLLMLAVHNLLDNAIKFTRPGDTIEVRAIDDGDHVIIEVADTGPGIPGDEIPHVWQELYRGSAAHGIPGSGLGLALVRAIISQHNGTLAIRSRPGFGTVITLRLPVGNLLPNDNMP